MPDSDRFGAEPGDRLLVHDVGRANGRERERRLWELECGSPWIDYHERERRHAFTRKEAHLIEWAEGGSKARVNVDGRVETWSGEKVVEARANAICHEAEAREALREKHRFKPEILAERDEQMARGASKLNSTRWMLSRAGYSGAQIAVMTGAEGGTRARRLIEGRGYWSDEYASPDAVDKSVSRAESKFPHERTVKAKPETYLCLPRANAGDADDYSDAWAGGGRTIRSMIPEYDGDRNDESVDRGEIRPNAQRAPRRLHVVPAPSWEAEAIEKADQELRRRDPEWLSRAIATGEWDAFHPPDPNILDSIAASDREWARLVIRSWRLAAEWKTTKRAVDRFPDLARMADGKASRMAPATLALAA